MCRMSCKFIRGSTVMNKISLFFDRLWQRGVPVSFVALTLLLATITVIVVGSGLHSAVIWLILAGVSILFVIACSCFKCKKRVSRWRRDSEQSDSVSTVMGENDFAHTLYAANRTRESITLSGDLPPCYTLATFPDRQPPPPYGAVAIPIRTVAASQPEEIFLPPSYSSIVTDPITVEYQPDDMTIPPPPYTSIDNIHIASADDSSLCQQRRQQHTSLESNMDSISIISSSDMANTNKNMHMANVMISQA